MNPADIVHGIIVYFTWLAPASDGLPGSSIIVEFHVESVEGETVHGNAKFGNSDKFHARSWNLKDVAKLGRADA